MENNQSNNPSFFSIKERNEDKQLVLKSIINKIEKGTDLTFAELKEKYSEDKLFQIALRYATTKKKAICEALKIPIEAGCRYKRELEKRGLLVQSTDEFICPYTLHEAHLISTNELEFEGLLKTSSNQLNLFK